MTFEDFGFAAALRDIKSRYGYRQHPQGTNKRRISVSLESIIADGAGKRGGATYLYDQDTNQYFLHYPVPMNYFPTMDHRSERLIENQERSEAKVIALDPGVRKFLVGVTSDYEVDVICNNKVIARSLRDIDKEPDKIKRNKMWAKVKNRIDDLHWKTIKYLTDHYDVIIVGDINVSSCVKKRGNGFELPRIVKRVLLQYSFYEFKRRLIWKCNVLGKKCILTDERYTSKGCCACGAYNDPKGKEIYSCSRCHNHMDRDLNGSINILIKTLTVLETLLGGLLNLQFSEHMTS
jgi:IS605 OrfB family transposase